MWTLTSEGGWAAPGQLECVSIGPERLLLVAVQKFPEGAEAPLSTTQNVLSCLRLHDLTVLIVHHSFILKIKRKTTRVRLCWVCHQYYFITYKGHRRAQERIKRHGSLQWLKIWVIFKRFWCAHLLRLRVLANQWTQFTFRNSHSVKCSDAAVIIVAFTL